MAYGAIDIANWLINKGIEDHNPLTPAKLQKLLYFVHALYLAYSGDPLINEEFEAWAYGPVIPDIYHEYKSYGRSEITKKRDTNLVLEPKDENFLNLFWQKWGNTPTSKLIELAHIANDPWDQSFRKGYYNSSIPNSIIKNCFQEKIMVKS